MAQAVRTLGILRFDIRYSAAPMPRIRPDGEKAAPMVQDLLADRAA